MASIASVTSHPSVVILFRTLAFPQSCGLGGMHLQSWPGSAGRPHLADDGPGAASDETAEVVGGAVAVDVPHARARHQLHTATAHPRLPVLRHALTHSSNLGGPGVNAESDEYRMGANLGC